MIHALGCIFIMLSMWLSLCRVFYHHAAHDFFYGGRDVKGYLLRCGSSLLAILCKVLGDFSAIRGEIKRTYKAWSIVVG